MNLIKLIIIKKKYFINLNFSIGNTLIFDIKNEKFKVKKFLGLLFKKNIKNFNYNFKLLKIFNGFFLKKTLYILSKNLISIKLYNKKIKNLNFYKKFIKF